MNQRFINAFQFDQQIISDESMIPYFGKHSAKYYIKGKPIKFGCKLWCLNTNLVILFIVIHIQVNMVIILDLV